MGEWTRRTALGVLGAGILSGCNGNGATGTGSPGTVDPGTGDPGTPGGEDPGSGPPVTRIRRDATAMAADDPALVAYGRAISAMRALPPADPRSLEAQARIHLNFCPHGNWWFLPWHRAYLGYFEEICRDLSGDDSFALPYWNWSSDGRLPPPFTDPGSPLFHPGRTAGPNAAAEPSMVGAPVINQLVLPEPNFEIFGSGRAVSQRQGSSQGPLEAQPHNHVHGFVGGDMQTFLSPLDPIFWLHHANVDRIWSIWRSRGNANPGDSVWRNLSYNEFSDRVGAPQTITTAEASSEARFGYSYDSLSVTPDFARREPFERLRASTQGAPLADLLRSTAPRIVLKSRNEAPVRVAQAHSLSVTARLTRPVIEPVDIEAGEGGLAVMRAAPPAEALIANPQRVIVKIGDIEAPQNRDLLVRVFVNCPYLSASTPVNDPHYVGSFAFFCGDGGATCLTGELAMTLDATDALRRIQPQGLDASRVEVQLMPLGLAGRSADNTEFFARTVEVAIV